MTERGWVILFSVLCVLSGVLSLVSWHGDDAKLAGEFALGAIANFAALAGAIHQATKEGR